MNTSKNHSDAALSSIVLPKKTPLHLRKLSVIMEMKFRALLSKNLIIGPVFAVGFSFLMDRIYNIITDGAVDMSGMALAMSS